MEETGQRISLRSNIFRELIANIIVHKEYFGGEPTRFIIEKDRILTENSNRSYINGIMNLSNLVPHPKNPNIARLFRQIGRVEKLGSGVRKLYELCKLYSGYDPVICDENVFKFSLRIDFLNRNLHQDTMHDNEKGVLLFCKVPKTRRQIQSHIKMRNRDYFRKSILNPLVKSVRLPLTMPDKPKSKNQKYVTKRGK
ncbi:MAG: hypothetical protein LBU10_05375 [Endomicrobium sp.]|jgi:ATP-dependent DNA helicase RecG|nr:hypothetical protein [Endomicrobium sp.]